jgi:uncharacterized membrane protein YedE/YeeE
MTLSTYLHKEIYKNLFEKTWPKWLGGLLLALLNILMFLYLMPIGGIYPAISEWGIWIYKLVGLKIEPPWGSLELPYLSITSVLSLGLISGVFTAALFSRQFKIRKDSLSGYVQGFAGGVLIGVGSFLVGACNVAGFYSGVMSLSLSGFYMMIGLIGGGYLGGRVMIWQGQRKAEKLTFELIPEEKNSYPKEYKSRQPQAGVFVILVLIVIVLTYFLIGKQILSGMFLFGIAFGVVFQRSGFCMAAAFREIFTTKNNEIMRNTMLSLIVGVIGFSIIKANGFRPENTFVLPAGWHTIIGGFIFGFGMVIAGGCAIGILWRSAEGYIRHWFSVFGAMLAAGLWVPIYGFNVGKGWLYGNPVFLPEKFGWGYALIITLAFLTAFYIFVTWLEVRTLQERSNQNE